MVLGLRALVGPRVGVKVGAWVGGRVGTRIGCIGGSRVGARGEVGSELRWD